jgi:hypothetical protein
MAKLTPNIPYDGPGHRYQIAEFSAALVMESSESVSYLALSDFRPERCGSRVVRRASFGDIEALAGELPMLPQRSYRIGSEQGFVVLVAAVIDRRYRWVVALEVSITVEISEVPVVPRKAVDRFGDRSGHCSTKLVIDRGVVLIRAKPIGTKHEGLIHI